MFFVAKILLTQQLKSQNIWLPNLKYQLKNKYPPLAKNFTKEYQSVVTYVLYHFCDMSLITVCEIFCSLKFHTVCTWTFFGVTIWLPTNRKTIKIVTLITVYRNALIDSHILFTYDYLHCFSVSNIWASHALEMTIFLYYQPMGCFFFHLPNLLLTQNFVYRLFSFRCHPPP